MPDIEELEENFEFILKDDVTWELTVEFMNQEFPENVLKKDQFEIQIRECFDNHEFVSADNFD